MKNCRLTSTHSMVTHIIWWPFICSHISSVRSRSQFTVCATHVRIRFISARLWPLPVSKWTPSKNSKNKLAQQWYCLFFFIRILSVSCKNDNEAYLPAGSRILHFSSNFYFLSKFDDLDGWRSVLNANRSTRTRIGGSGKQEIVYVARCSKEAKEKKSSKTLRHRFLNI